jgi:uncharacterized protein (TIGR02246 family)
VADDKAAITAALGQYQSALNASSTSAVMQLYAPDGVFMAQNFPTAIGTEEVCKAYDRTFNMIALSVEFSILEVVPINDEWAFARTSSAGTVKDHATGAGGPEANQELFVLQKIEGVWKIARYCFSTTNPPH